MTVAAAHRGEGLTPIAMQALGIFSRALTSEYGQRLVGAYVFGSRSRGDARSGSDLDVAVVLVDDVVDGFREKMRMADLAYDATVETAVHVQPWPLSAREWKRPEAHRNPRLVRAIHRDGLEIRTSDGRVVCEGRGSCRVGA